MCSMRMLSVMQPITSSHVDGSVPTDTPAEGPSDRCESRTYPGRHQRDERRHETAHVASSEHLSRRGGPERQAAEEAATGRAP